ncbi:acyltransferase [Massilia sp. erpn]|uniref:acyltransferase family protein n=1 Tax=Massilia sp. erpn TaxID=2738142 RepID=UPI0021085331|nr:acyltransferase [Massilia sp. erpn]UTY58031.1 acyltransferase [Massilia sp. erpn]
MSSKLVFAHQLRGFAAILIVVTHYFGIFYGAQQVVANVTFSPNLNLTAPGWTSYMAWPYLNGPFGVALFFLISGLVIPFSLRSNSPRAFMVARLFRIYPTYLFCLGIGLLAIFLSAHYWQQAFALPGRQVASNLLLVHNLLGEASLDTVNWTLAIELKFYLLAALAPAMFLRPNLRAMALFVVTVIGLNLMLPGLALAMPGKFAQIAMPALVSDLNYVCFMLAGVLFYQHLQGQLGLLRLAAGCALLLGGFSLAWSLGPQKETYPILIQYYYCAFGLFSVCFLLRRYFRPQRILDFLADISYPLYAVHSLTGYALLKMVMNQGLSFGRAVVLTVILIFALAWLIHKTVEIWSSAYGKKIGGQFAPRAAAAT